MMARKDNNNNVPADEIEDIIIEKEDEDVQQNNLTSKSGNTLRAELKKSQKEAREYLEGWQRAKADLINSKRENEKERREFAKFAVQDILLQLLPVLDSFDAALAHTNDQGVKQIYKQLFSVLEANSVRQYDPIGEPFDPVRHDSVESVQVENKNHNNTIVEVVQKGYTLHNKIIRPARVKVGEYKS